MKKTDDNRRVNRVEKEVMQTIASFLSRGFKIRLPGLVTVSRVMMPGDLKSAKVYISVLGADDQKDEVIEILEDNRAMVQDHIARELKLRFCPKLKFFLDESLDKVLKVEKILDDLSRQKSAQQKQDSDENE